MIGGELIAVTVRPSEENLAFTPEPMDLDIIYEDDTVIVINKPAGLVVHPAAGNWSGTLLNGLLAHCPELSQVPRAGIVHRLDKETSGLMVVAKTLPAQNSLVQQLQERTVKRIYRAIANGIVPFDGKIETQIGRDPHNRLKMASSNSAANLPSPTSKCWNVIWHTATSNARSKPAARTKSASICAKPTIRWPPTLFTATCATRAATRLKKPSKPSAPRQSPACLPLELYPSENRRNRFF